MGGVQAFGERDSLVRRSHVMGPQHLCIIGVFILAARSESRGVWAWVTQHWLWVGRRKLLSTAISAFLIPAIQRRKLRLCLPALSHGWAREGTRGLGCGDSRREG